MLQIFTTIHLNNPDYIGPLTGIDSKGRRLIEFRLRVDGTNYTATAYPNVGTKKHDLDIDTFYIKKNPSDTPDDIMSSGPTSKTSIPQGSFVNSKVTGAGENVNKDFISSTMLQIFTTVHQNPGQNECERFHRRK